MTVEELADRTARAIAPEGQGEEVATEAVRIAQGNAASGHLVAAEMIALAGLTVQVCVIVVESAKLVHGYFERNRNDQLLLVLEKLAEQSGDPTVSTDPTIVKVARAACDALGESKVD